MSEKRLTGALVGKFVVYSKDLSISVALALFLLNNYNFLSKMTQMT